MIEKKDSHNFTSWEEVSSSIEELKNLSQFLELEGLLLQPLNPNNRYGRNGSIERNIFLIDKGNNKERVYYDFQGNDISLLQKDGVDPSIVEDITIEITSGHIHEERHGSVMEGTDYHKTRFEPRFSFCLTGGKLIFKDISHKTQVELLIDVGDLEKNKKEIAVIIEDVTSKEKENDRKKEDIISAEHKAEKNRKLLTGFGLIPGPSIDLLIDPKNNSSFEENITGKICLPTWIKYWIGENYALVSFYNTRENRLPVKDSKLDKITLTATLLIIKSNGTFGIVNHDGIILSGSVDEFRARRKDFSTTNITNDDRIESAFAKAKEKPMSFEYLGEKPLPPERPTSYSR